MPCEHLRGAGKCPDCARAAVAEWVAGMDWTTSPETLKRWMMETRHD